MMKISRNAGAALLALSLLGSVTLARAGDGVEDWPQRANAGPAAEKRSVDRVDQTVYRPMGTNAGTPERAAEDAFFNRQFGGVPPT